MPELTYRTTTEIGAPLLITAKALRELDTVIATQLPKLKEAQEQLISDKVDERISKSAWALGQNPPAEKVQELRLDYAEQARKELLEGYSTEVVVRFLNGSRLKAKSFDEAASHAEISDSVPTGFEVEVKAGSVSARINTGSYGPGLDISVSPSAYEPPSYFFSALRTWGRSIEAPRWQPAWVDHELARFLLWALWFAVVFTWFSIHVDTAAKNYYREQAHKILKDGVNSGNEQKALETLLALQSEYSPPTPGEPLGRRFWFFTLGGLTTCIILNIHPKLEIGLGKGEHRILAWRRWMKFVFVAVPGSIASTFVWPALAQAIRWAIQ